MAGSPWVSDELGRDVCEECLEKAKAARRYCQRCMRVMPLGGHACRDSYPWEVRS